LILSRVILLNFGDQFYRNKKITWLDFVRIIHSQNIVFYYLAANVRTK
jgi:hypothetical protein